MNRKYTSRLRYKPDVFELLTEMFVTIQRDMVDLPMATPQTTMGLKRRMCTILWNEHIQTHRIAWYLGVSETTVREYVHYVRDNKMYDSTPPGNPNKIPLEAHEKVQAFINRYKECDLELFAEYMKSLGYSYARSTYVKMLNLNGGSYKYPSTAMDKNSPELMINRSTTCNKVLNKVDDFDVVVSIDETPFNAKEILHRKVWCGKGQTAPPIKQDPSKLSTVSGIVMCDNFGLVTCHAYEKTVKAVDVEQFVETNLENQLKPYIKSKKTKATLGDNADVPIESTTRSRREGLKVLVLIDNARVHSPEYFQSDLPDRLRDKKIFLTTEFLPPYTPDANPAEYVHRMIKTRVWQHIKALEEGPVSADTFYKLLYKVFGEVKNTLKLTNIYEHTYKYMAAVIEAEGHSINAKKVLKQQHLIPTDAYDIDLAEEDLGVDVCSN